MTAATTTFAAGELLAERFRVVRYIARGGTAEVYEVVDEVLGSRLALKALLGERASGRARRELSIARRVTHPNVCRVFDIDTARGTPYVTMELLEGETLAARIAREGRLSPGAALPIVEQLVAGLAAAHDAGVVHGDFKPHNVFLAGERVVVADFGLARAIDREGTERTTTIEFGGSPAYMAPEQVRDEDVTTSTDIFALGITMFEMVTGAPPFAGSSTVALAMRRVREPAPRAGAACPGLDPRWDAAIARCLERDPRDRFRRIDDVTAALRAPVRLRPRRAGASAFVAMLLALGVARIQDSRDAHERAPTLRTHVAGPVAMTMPLGATHFGMIQRAQRTRDGDLVIAGHLGSSAVIGGAAVEDPRRSRLGYVARLAGDGRTRWLRTFESERDSQATWSTVDEDTGVVVVVGGYIGALALGSGVALPAAPHTSVDCFVAAIDARTGDARWARSCGATKSARARRVVLDGEGRAYVTGELAGASLLSRGGSGDKGLPGWFVASYDRSGELRWATRAEVDPEQALAKGLAVAGGSVWIAGSVAGEMTFGGVHVRAGSDLDAAIAELDAATGRVRWVRTFGGPGRQFFNAVDRLADGRLVVAGAFEGSIDLAGRHLTSRGGVDAVVAFVDRRGDAVRAWHLGSRGFDGMIDLAVHGTTAIAYGRAREGLDVDGRLVAAHPDVGQILFRVDGDGRSTTTPLLGIDASARSVAWSPTGVLVAGRFAKVLSVGEVALTTEKVDGYAIELRAPLE